jgi:hypothetical protein
VRCVGILLACLTVAGCGGDEPSAQAPVRQETPLDAIRRVGDTWVSSDQSRSLRSAPSPIAMYEVTTRSTVVFRADKRWTPEVIEIEESFQMRDGRQFLCRARSDTHSDLSFGRRDGDPAVEMRRPATRLHRNCDPPDFPEPDLLLPAAVARFRLTGDRLQPFDPPLEKRVYIPAP